ncbi:MAG: PhzF family phenazine biosynthesis protein [Asticcacaulis sp.]|uniref:PhzF family phenazine biosynthesis protein n=1 Tax=Asticcacaulis sp. TaxID=1872648 RepID=UPI003F7BE14D
MRPFKLVDVFATGPFSGNPLAVICDAEGLSTDEMLSITRWLNLSETTFILQPTDEAADYCVRIFTPDRELPFAGHPTLGTAHVWLENGGRPKTPGRIVQQCDIGLVPLRHADELAFAAPPLIRSGPVDEADLEDALAVLQIERAAVVDARWVDNGPGWLGVRLASADAVRAVRPLGSYPKRMDIGVVGLETGGGTDVEIRAIFSDQTLALREDPVTGSLNASVAQWLLGAGLLNAPYTAAQGTCLGRTGRVRVTQDADHIWIGGATRTLFSGTTT